MEGYVPINGQFVNTNYMYHSKGCVELYGAHVPALKLLCPSKGQDGASMIPRNAGDGHACIHQHRVCGGRRGRREREREEGKEREGDEREVRREREMRGGKEEREVRRG